ncbi:MAG: hypothetical protein ACXWVS_12160 [Hyphomicrobium sp.]
MHKLTLMPLIVGVAPLSACAGVDREAGDERSLVDSAFDAAGGPAVDASGFVADQISKSRTL